MTDDTTEFAREYREFMKAMSRAAPPEKPPTIPFFFQRLHDHFGMEPRIIPVIEEEFELSDHPNLQLALNAFLEAGDTSSELYGMHDFRSPMGARLASFAVDPPQPAPVQFVNLPSGPDETVTCIKTGVLFVTQGERRLVVMLLATDRFGPQTLRMDVMGRAQDDPQGFIIELKAEMRRRNIYRGHVLTFGGMERGGFLLQFHTLPKIGRGDIILPAGVLERIERHTITFAEHADALLAAGRQLKRGILLYGPPGTGKTFSAMYLAAQMRERTVILLTGGSLGMIRRACHIARVLQPSMIVLEDVDLVAQERTHYEHNSVLFELLNGMDGLADDLDVIFLLTTNRPDLLEPALASRPGRVDQAVELPLPDPDCRRRLIALYGEGLRMQVEDMDRIVERTHGGSAAFIKELLRKAALFAAEDGDGMIVRDGHLDEALHELVVAGGPLTRTLLGAEIRDA